MRRPVPYLCPHGKEFPAYDLQLVIECIFLLAAGGGIIGDDHRSFLAPILSLGPVGQKAFLFLPLLHETTVDGHIHRFEPSNRGCGEFLGEIGGIGGDEVNARVVVDPGVILIGVHPLVDHHREPILGLFKPHTIPNISSMTASKCLLSWILPG